jgi:transposase
MASLTKKVINGRPYYYLRESAWVDGRPKVVRTTYLGRAEDIERRLAEEPGEPKEIEVRSFGAVAAALKLCSELGVAEAIDRAVGARGGRRRGPSVGEMIMLAAINRACKPRSKRQLSDWHRRTALVRLLPAERRALSSQRFWDAMHVLGDRVIAKAETEIVRRCIDLYGIELRPLVYDTTNFATFIDSANARNTIAQRGHPKGGRRDLRLVGLALCVALDSNIPLCHQTYEGNRNDSTQFPAAIELIKTRLEDLGLTEQELSELTLVYDKGNNSKTNQPLADELSLGVVGSLSPSQHPELLDVDRNEFHELEGMPGTLAHRTRMEVYGQERTIVVSYSQPFAAKQRRSFEQTLAKAHRELDELRGIVERGKHRMDERALEERVKSILRRRWLKDVLTVEHDLDACRFQYRTDPDQIEQIAQREWGRRIIFTGRHEWTNQEIIAAYRAQSKGENAFRQDKDREFVSYSPAFHWTDQKLKVHGFYCTLALMIVSLIERQIRHADIHQDDLPLGAKLAMRLLNEIDEVTLIYPPAGGRQGRPRIRTRIATMDETQQQLYTALDLSPLAPSSAFRS